MCTSRTSAECSVLGGTFNGAGTTCAGDADGDGWDDLCGSANPCNTFGWQAKCDPGGICAYPPMPPPQGPPGPGEPCDYPNRQVCLPFNPYCGLASTACWESQCVCQCAGDSAHMNCVRSCIRCADDNGAPATIETELYCSTRCNLTSNEIRRLFCCLLANINDGGCFGGGITGGTPPMNPNPGNTNCTGIQIP